MSARSDASMLKRAKPRTEPFKVLLDLGDGLLDDYAAKVDSLSNIPDDVEHEDEIEKARVAVVKANEALQGCEFHGRLKVLPLLAWESLKAEHPPREGNDLDAMVGVDRSHAPDLIRPCALLEDGEPFTDEQWDDFEVAVGSGDWYRLLDQVLSLNERGVSVPKLPSDWRRPQGRRSGSK